MLLSLPTMEHHTSVSISHLPTPPRCSAHVQVRQALGVGNREWQACSKSVYFAFMLDFPRNIEPRVVQLLGGGVRVLVYAGDKDYICNWMGECGGGGGA